MKKLIYVFAEDVVPDSAVYLTTVPLNERYVHYFLIDYKFEPHEQNPPSRHHHAHLSSGGDGGSDK